ncbi:MAG: hypothetical protein ACRD9R_20540 [Pyrinomonadaceae bacterium]
MNYPLNISFKLLALASQLSVTDAAGNLVFYVKQKAFKLKENVGVFADREQTRQLYTIKADRVLDFSGRYQFTDEHGLGHGSIKRQGMKSLWKSHYEIYDGELVAMTIREENAWVKVLDALFGEIPVLGMFTGYIFHPAYIVARSTGQPLLRVAKQPAFFEGKFVVEKQGEMNEAEERRALLGVVMMILLERARG